MSRQPDRRHLTIGTEEEHEHAESWQVRTCDGPGHWVCSGSFLCTRMVLHIQLASPFRLGVQIGQLHVYPPSVCNP